MFKFSSEFLYVESLREFLISLAWLRFHFFWFFWIRFFNFFFISAIRIELKRLNTVNILLVRLKN